MYSASKDGQELGRSRREERGWRLNATPFLRQWPSFSVTVLTVLRIRWLPFVLWPAPLFAFGILGMILATLR